MSKEYRGIDVAGDKLRVTFFIDGKKHRIKTNIAPTKNGYIYAQQLLKDIKSDVRRGAFTLQKHFPDHAKVVKPEQTIAIPTFKECGEAWLKTHINKPKSTQHCYRTYFNAWLPYIGDRPINEVTDIELEDAILKMPIVAKTRNNYRIPVRAIFKRAVKAKQRTDNPAAELTNEKIQPNDPIRLDHEERVAVLLWMEEHLDPRVTDYYKVQIYTGMRPSEAIALDWTDSDFLKQQLRVTKALVRGEIKSTKTYEKRTIDLLSPALAALKRQKKFTFMKKSGKIFENPVTGESWVSSDDLVKYWHQALKALGIPERDPYATRHTFASLMLSAGVKLPYLANQMGHKNVSITLKTYACWIDSENETEKAKVEAMLETDTTTAIKVASDISTI